LKKNNSFYQYIIKSFIFQRLSDKYIGGIHWAFRRARTYYLDFFRRLCYTLNETTNQSRGGTVSSFLFCDKFKKCHDFAICPAFNVFVLDFSAVCVTLLTKTTARTAGGFSAPALVCCFVYCANCSELAKSEQLAVFYFAINSRSKCLRTVEKVHAVGFIAHYRSLPCDSITLTELHSQSCGGKNVSPTRFSSPFESLRSKNKRQALPVLLFLAMGYKKDILGIIEYEFDLLHKSRRKPCISSIPQELHIIKTKFCISSLRKEMQPAADDMHLR